MTGELFELWIYLSASPLLGLTLTLVAYLAGDALYRRAGRHPLANPVLVGVLLLGGLLLATGTDYADYFEGAQFVHFLLGPATVALAVPLYRNVAAVRRSAPAIVSAVTIGSLAAAASAVGLAWAFGGSDGTLLALAPKSVTAPVAMGIAEKIGGAPSLTAVLVILTGVTGATFGGLAMDAVGLRDMRARGFAMGLASHGIGTARALTVSGTAGAFASLAMALNALATATLLPLIGRWLM